MVSGPLSAAGLPNAPLLIALDSAGALKKFVVVDERSAAFQALGYALVRRQPVMLVCTSGSAVLNYAPAIAEAYYAGVPLVIVSADRRVNGSIRTIRRRFGNLACLTT